MSVTFINRLESEIKGASVSSVRRKFSEDERGEIWIKCFNWILPEQRMQSMSVTFINRI